MARRELVYQTDLVNEAKAAGGYGRKLSSSYAVGVLDLMFSFKSCGVHIMELKHLPTWDGVREVKNPMSAKQKIEAKKLMNAGVVVSLGVITGARRDKSALYMLYPLAETITTVDRVNLFASRTNKIYGLEGLLVQWMEISNEHF